LFHTQCARFCYVATYSAALLSTYDSSLNVVRPGISCSVSALPPPYPGYTPRGVQPSSRTVPCHLQPHSDSRRSVRRVLIWRIAARVALGASSIKHRTINRTSNRTRDRTGKRGKTVYKRIEQTIRQPIHWVSRQANRGQARRKRDPLGDPLGELSTSETNKRSVG
jgi:hypothetical protein